MDIRGVEITNQLRSAIRAKLLELGVRYDDELPDYILVMVVNKKSRSQMNEDLRLFLEDSTESFVDWLHDQVLKKLQKVTVAKKKAIKEVSTANVKKEEDKKDPKIEDETTKSDTPTREPTKVERDKEFDDLVGDLAMLNEEDGKSDLKESQMDEDRLQITHTDENDGDSSIDSSPKTPERIIESTCVSIPKSSGNKEEVTTETLSEKVNTSNKSLKRMSTDDSSDNVAQSAKRSKISNDSDSEDDDRIKSSISKPKITSVVTVKTKIDMISPQKMQEPEIRRTDARSVSPNKTELSSQKNSSNQSKSIDRRKPRTEDLRSESQKDNRHAIHNSNSEKSNRVEGSTSTERLSTKSSTIKSRLGMNSNKKEVSPLKSTNSTKVSKLRISNVKSRLGIRSRQAGRKLLSTTSRLSKISQKHFEEDDDAESVINTSLKSHIIAVQKSRPQMHKQISLDSLDKSQNLIEEETEEDNDEDDECKILSKVIVTPRPLKPLKPVQKRATQSLLLKAVAEANQSVVMQKKIDPCLKEQRKRNNKIKITRDPWEGKILSVSLNGKRRNVMEKIQVELTNANKTKKRELAKKSDVVTNEHMDVVKSLFKRSDDKQKFLVTLNGYNNNVLKEKNSDDEERLDIELIDIEEELALNSQYDVYDDEVQVIAINKVNNTHPSQGQNQDIPQVYADKRSDNRTGSHPERYTEKCTDKRQDNYANSHPDRCTDKHTDKRSDHHANSHPDRYTDKCSDRRPDNYRNPHSDRCADKSIDKRPDNYANSYADRRTDKYPNKPADNFIDPYPDRATDKRSDNYINPYPDKHANKYPSKPVDNFIDPYPDPSTDKHKDTYVDNYIDPYPNRSIEKYTDQYLKPYDENNQRKENENRNKHLHIEEFSAKSRRKLSPIIYTRSRSNSSEKRPRVASKITSVLRYDKRPLISSIITTVADKSSEKCRYWPNCTLGVKCAYSHPEVLCSSFPACKFGEKCAYKHPKCKFGSACTKLGCKFSHPPVKCKYHPYCMKPGCQFSHPKAASTASLTQPLTPDMSTVRAKFTWKKKD